MKSLTSRTAITLRRMASFFVGTVLLMELNVLASRHPRRFSFGRGESFELTPSAADFFNDTRRELKITGFVIRGEENGSILGAALESIRLQGVPVAIIDPVREKTRYLEAVGDLELPGETALALVEGPQRRVLIPHDAGATSYAKTVDALQSAASRTLQTASSPLCFVTGHGERSPLDSGPGGLSRFRLLLTSSGAEVRPWDILEESSEECGSILIAGLTEPFTPTEENALLRASASGHRFALMLDPVLDSSGRVGKTGLEKLSQAFGVRLTNNVILEEDPSERPGGQPVETLFARSGSHPLGKFGPGERPVVQFTRELELMSETLAQSLLLSSENARTLSKLRGNEPPETRRNGAILAAGTARAPNAPSGAIGVLFGTSSLFDNAHLEQAGTQGNVILARRLASFLTQTTVAPAAAEATPAPRSEWSESTRRTTTWLALVWLPLSLTAVATVFLLLQKRLRSRALP